VTGIYKKRWPRWIGEVARGRDLRGSEEIPNRFSKRQATPALLRISLWLRSKPQLFDLACIAHQCLVRVIHSTSLLRIVKQAAVLARSLRWMHPGGLRYIDCYVSFERWTRRLHHRRRSGPSSKRLFVVMRANTGAIPVVTFFFLEFIALLFL
jgi:hypothetical protein